MLLSCGKDADSCEVVSITTTGFWLLFAGQTSFISFQDYPVFSHASSDDILSVRVDEELNAVWNCFSVKIKLF